MKYNMKLTSGPFKLIKSGKKSIEIRLYDEKRSSINIGDSITFTELSDKESQIESTVIGLIRYKSFSDMFDSVDVGLFGGKDKESLLEGVYKFYSKEKEKKYGVLGIHIKKVA